MKVNLPLDQMTVAEKLTLLDILWDDLRRHGSGVESPVWHGKLLAARQAELDAGRSIVSDWSEAKERIRNRTRKGPEFSG